MACVVTGWDIGGANVKAARIRLDGGIPVLLSARTEPFELWKRPEALPDVLAGVASQIGGTAAVALTMTAELCDCFPTKRDGVRFVLEAAGRALPDVGMWILTNSGRWLTGRDALRAPLQVAAANWVATGTLAGIRYTDTVLIDVGSTTTDIVPVVAGRVRARGRTDPSRLASGELIYTGALRTDVAAIVRRLPLRGRWVGVAAERFAIAGDVHLVLGALKPEDYACEPPDNGERSVAGARRRLARLVCADEELLTSGQIDDLARFACHRQVVIIAEGLAQVLSTMSPRPHTAVVTGLGAFLAKTAADACGLRAVDLGDALGLPDAAPLSAVAVAWLLARWLEGSDLRGRPP
ncbi:MAG: hydantoinase/oxoprolinase family protein [Armatimonadota bacterium]|nr:hydantoinase/oxoprolinase family protein [Armatimonadota bacterium]